jgi:hypothetical protein
MPAPAHPPAPAPSPASRLEATVLAAPYRCAECGAQAVVTTTVSVRHGQYCLTGARLRGMRSAA